MARVKFGRLALNPVADPTTGTTFRLNDLSHAPLVTLEIRRYAAGNLRVVRQPGKQKVATVALNWCTDAQVAQLEAWQGVLLCFRDPTGRKFFGVYDQPGFAPRQMGNSWAVTLTVSEATWTAS